jgi:hypothetical protein
MLQRIDASLGQSYQQWRCSSHPHHNWARNFNDSLERIAMTLRIPCELRIQENSMRRLQWLNAEPILRIPT